MTNSVPSIEILPAHARMNDNECVQSLPRHMLWAYVVWDLNLIKQCAAKGHQVANLVRIPGLFSPASCAQCGACNGLAKVQVLLQMLF